jgi:hypothetical protein
MSTQPTPIQPSSALQSAMAWSSFSLSISSTVLELVMTLQRMFGKKVPGAKKAKIVQAVVQSAAPGADPAEVQPVIDASVQAYKDIEHPLFVEKGA